MSWHGDQQIDLHAFGENVERDAAAERTTAVVAATDCPPDLEVGERVRIIVDRTTNTIGKIASIEKQGSDLRLTIDWLDRGKQMPDDPGNKTAMKREAAEQPTLADFEAKR